MRRDRSPPRRGSFGKFADLYGIRTFAWSSWILILIFKDTIQESRRRHRCDQRKVHPQFTPTHTNTRSPPLKLLSFSSSFTYIPNYESKHPTTSIMALSAPSTDPNVLLAQETSADQIFPTFTADTAWQLGNALRDRILSLPEGQRKPALVSIALSGGAPLHVVFQSATESGTIPDNENWVRRKRNTVLRFGVSSWTMRQKTVSGLAAGASADDVEAAFVSKYAVPSATGGAVADEYAIHGGAYPIRVRGVDGIIGVVVVSGLKQEDDHQVVAETIQAFIAQQAK